MRSLLAVILACGGLLSLAGCGSNLLLRVYTVTDGPPSHVLPKSEPAPAPSPSLGGVKIFFYPYVRDSVIHQVPEREFVTDYRGRAEYIETLSPLGDKMGALVAMKGGFQVDTLLFPFDLNDTVTVVIRLLPRRPGR